IEALTNIARHAQAGQVTIDLDIKPQQVIATVKDDGVGFDTGNLRLPLERHSLGLVSMRERAELLGGQFTLTSSPGHGTTVQAVLPLPPRDSQGDYVR
ncbi:MAG: ATP-binding protein, partial [Anaerolineae bacterium]|nr:ATP-binding protein [Anaerolineae bacterium]